MNFWGMGTIHPLILDQTSMNAQHIVDIFLDNHYMMFRFLPNIFGGCGKIESEQIYQDFRNHLIESRHRSYEQFDKAVFLLSGGGLTISLTLINSIIPLSTASSIDLLVASWILFVLPLILTLLSFIFCQKAIDRQIELTDDYFLKDDKSALSKPNRFSVITKYMNYASAVSFVAGVMAILRFVYINISI